MPRHPKKKQPDYVPLPRKKLDLTNCKFQPVKKGLWIAVKIGVDVQAAVSDFKRRAHITLPLEDTDDTTQVWR